MHIITHPILGVPGPLGVLHKFQVASWICSGKPRVWIPQKLEVPSLGSSLNQDYGALASPKGPRTQIMGF